jgi:hypothetical protein
VHFSLMPAFTTARRRRTRSSGTIRLVAIDFGVHERTLRRWLARPALRPVLRAYRHGKQWRLDVPKTALAFALYKRDVLRAVRPFRRKRHKRISRLAKKVARALGYDGNQERERDLRILQVATTANLVERGINFTERHHSDRTTTCVGLARILSLKYNCGVFDVREHLDPKDRSHRAAIFCWPTPQQWAKACVDYDRQWQIRSLKEAAFELARDNQPRISGPKLAPLLFLNELRELVWKQSQRVKEIQRRHDRKADDKNMPRDRFFNPPVPYPNGGRGISLRLFRDRYKREDIADARKLAEGLVQ